MSLEAPLVEPLRTRAVAIAVDKQDAVRRLAVGTCGLLRLAPGFLGRFLLVHVLGHVRGKRIAVRAIVFEPRLEVLKAPLLRRA